MMHAFPFTNVGVSTVVGLPGLQVVLQLGGPPLMGEPFGPPTCPADLKPGRLCTDNGRRASHC